VTRDTVGEAGVAEVGRLPDCGRVTVAALAGIVIGWSVIRMATDAVGKAGVIEVGWFPGRLDVAIAALAGIVILRRVDEVAGLTIREAGVVEGGRLENNIGVAGCAIVAQALVLAFMRIFVTGRARGGHPRHLAADMASAARDLSMPPAERRLMRCHQIDGQLDAARGDAHGRRFGIGGRNLIEEEQQAERRGVRVGGRFADGVGQSQKAIDLGIVAPRCLPARQRICGAQLT